MYQINFNLHFFLIITEVEHFPSFLKSYLYVFFGELSLHKFLFHFYCILNFLSIQGALYTKTHDVQDTQFSFTLFSVDLNTSGAQTYFREHPSIVNGVLNTDSSDLGNSETFPKKYPDLDFRYSCPSQQRRLCLIFIIKYPYPLLNYMIFKANESAVTRSFHSVPPRKQKFGVLNTSSHEELFEGNVLQV